MVMREAAVLLAIGVAAGIAIAFVAGRDASSLLFELKASDPFTLGTAVLLLVFVGTLASLIPALRASQVDPIAALRCE